MGYYKSVFFMDAITYPCPNPDTALTKLALLVKGALEDDFQLPALNEYWEIIQHLQTTVFNIKSVRKGIKYI